MADTSTEPLPDDEWGPDKPIWRQLPGAIRAADRCLALGDAAAALLAMNRPAVYRAEDLQAHARLAAAFLETEPAGAPAQFGKARALAGFVDLAAKAGLDRTTHGSSELPIASAWDHEKLGRLAATARAWLEEFARPTKAAPGC